MLEILPTESGVPTARLDGRYLHSARNPLHEARRTIAATARREPPGVVFLGMGLAYGVEALLEQTEESHAIVFEPDPELREKALEARAGAPFLSSDRLHVCDTIDGLADALSLYAAPGFEVHTLNARRMSDPQAFSRADEVVQQFRSRVDINSNTLSRFGRLWVRNLCRNLDELASGLPLSAIAGAFTQKPGLLLAAGPGLDQVLPELADLSRRCVVVAVDTAVAAARSRGVAPDFAVVVDPQYWNSRHLDSVAPAETLLVAESSTHPSVFRHFRSPTIFCASLFPLGKKIEAVLEPLGSLGTGGSVSTTAWDLLRYLGCTEIYVAGLDLAFPNGRTHFRGSFFENRALAVATRLAPAEGTLHRYVSSGDPFTTTAAGGGTVLTDRRMEIYRAWFARQLVVEGDATTYTLTTGGSRIAGMESARVAEVLQKADIRDEIRRAVSDLAGHDETTVQLQKRRIRSGFAQLLTNLSALESVARRALASLVTVERDLAAGNPADFTAISRIDEDIRSIGGRGIAGFLMHDAISSIRSGFGSANIDEQISASRRLYEELRDSARFHVDTITDVLDRK